MDDRYVRRAQPNLALVSDGSGTARLSEEVWDGEAGEREENNGNPKPVAGAASGPPAVAATNAARTPHQRGSAVTGVAAANRLSQAPLELAPPLETHIPPQGDQGAEARPHVVDGAPVGEIWYPTSPQHPVTVAEAFRNASTRQRHHGPPAIAFHALAGAGVLLCFA